MVENVLKIPKTCIFQDNLTQYQGSKGHSAISDVGVGFSKPCIFRTPAKCVREEEDLFHPWVQQQKGISKA